jgi:hypothetical protein
LHVGAEMAKENWFICFNMVFVDERFEYFAWSSPKLEKSAVFTF